MRRRLPPGKYILIFAVALALIPFVIGQNPFAKLDDYAAIQEDILSANIVPIHGTRSTYYELRIVTGSNSIFYIRRPEVDMLERYFMVLPRNGLVTIHYLNTLDGRQIVDLRRGALECIPFSETKSEAASKMFFIFSFAAVIGLIGLLKLGFDKQVKGDEAATKTA